MSDAPPAAASQPVAPQRSLYDVAYPPVIRAWEAQAIQHRRAQTNAATPLANSARPAPPATTRVADPKPPVAALPADTLGVALSGGGIRGATFGLGVLQSMAAVGWAKQIDFLSTVSGGGYIGSFWCAWLNRLRSPTPTAPAIAAPSAETSTEPGATTPVTSPPALDPETVRRLGRNIAEAEQKLADCTSEPISWLRENGRYLTPAGSDDVWLAATVIQRNFLALQLLAIASVWTVSFYLAVLWCPASTPGTPPYLAPFYWEWHGIYFAGLTLYWTLTGLALALGVSAGVAYFFFPTKTDRGRNSISRGQAYLLIATVALLLLAAVDTMGATLAATIANHTSAWWFNTVRSLFAAIAGAGTLSVLSRSLRLGLLAQTKKLGSGGFGSAAIAAGAMALGAVWLVAIATIAHASVSWLQLVPSSETLAGSRGFAAVAPSAFKPWALSFALWVPLAVWVVPYLYRLLSGSSLTNTIALASFYEARLTRAYLGASNPRRGRQRDVTDTIDGDQVPFTTYFPHEAGGPLHLVNITINETLDPHSAVTRGDRKGVPFAVTPFGLTAGIRHHVQWKTNEMTGARTGEVVPVDLARAGFHLWRKKESRFLWPWERAGAGSCVELCHLGQWLAISGAAFTPGLGSRTKPTLSFLLTFFNVRLGWWWRSGIHPWQRVDQEGGLLRRIARRIGYVFHCQSQLYDEFLARFHGTASSEWYLSDGGHFENTAAYELIRRRVPQIVIVDAGCDPERSAEDFGNLVRKARIDFQAEIAVLSADALKAVATKLGAERSAGFARVFGTLDQVYHRPKEGHPNQPALIARVTYEGTTESSVLIVLKPTMRGVESAAERNYSVQNPDFPQQTTEDQFFDEAQWESYRRIGQEIGAEVFTFVKDPGFFPAVKAAGP